MSVTLKTVKNDVGKLTPKLRKGIANALNSGAFEHESQAKQFVHVLTGFTRSTIQTEAATEDNLKATVSAGGGAIFEELGTVYRPPHPFFLPAFEIGKKQAEDELEDVLK